MPTSKARSPKILILGWRREAVEAALRLGFSVAIAAQDRPTKEFAKQIQSVIQVEDYFALPELLEFARDWQPEFVIAVTEKTVLPAAAIREALGLPGLYPQQALLFHDKFLMKKHAQAGGFACAPYVLVSEDGLPSIAESELNLPLIIKPTRLSGGRDLSLAVTAEAVEEIAQPGHLLEEYVLGQELSVESLVCDGQIIFQNTTEYFIRGHVNIVPAAFSPELQEQIDLFNRRVLAHFPIQNGMTHLELFVSENGLVFGEIAVRPPGGYLMKLIKMAYGIDIWGSFLQLETGQALDIHLPKANGFSGVWVVHPGGGLVQAVRGVHELRTLKQITEAKIRLKEGDVLNDRKGLGEDRGTIFFKSESYSDILDGIERSQETLQIQMQETEMESHVPS
jgi:biotin carboxylase